MKCLKEFRLSQLLTAANILHVSLHTEKCEYRYLKSLL